MKNKIEFLKNTISETSPNINQTSAGSSFEQNLFSKESSREKIKAFKVVKGKVKITNNHNELRFAKNYQLNDQTELEIVWNRMLLFVKFTFLFLLLFSIFMLFK